MIGTKDRWRIALDTDSPAVRNFLAAGERKEEDMKRKAVIVLVIGAAVLSAASCSKPDDDFTVEVVEEQAKEETVTQEFDFYSDDEHLILYNFPELYEADGKSYVMSDNIDYETLGTRDTVQMEVDMNVEDMEEIPDTYTYESESGNKYELENEQVYVSEQGLVKIPVIEEVYYEDQVGKPSIPSKKMITYYDKKAGEDRQIEGMLKDFTESTAGHWANILNIEGTFMAPSDSCDVYELAGSPNVTVSRAAETPVWPGYENNILSSLGVSNKYYRVTGASWNGNQYEQDGYIMRNARFTGDIFVSTYKATYAAEREAEGYKTKVFYRVDAEDVDAPAEDVTTVYHIKAVVTYKLLGR